MFVSIPPQVSLNTAKAYQLLYAFPIIPNSESAILRLSTLAKGLGPHGLSLMVDHPAQLPAIEAIHSTSGIAPDIFMKIE